jgi:ribosomal-protein-alanine N-acetyltransferase
MQALATARLRLEPLVAAHADALHPRLADPRMFEFFDHPPPPSLEALRERYRKLETRRSADRREHWLNWALVLHAGPAFDAIGCVQATVLEDRRAWVAYEVAHALWGQGLAGEAMRAVLEHLATHHGVTRCMASVDARNRRSWRLLERLGFGRAGPTQAAALEVEAGDWLYLR